MGSQVAVLRVWSCDAQDGGLGENMKVHRSQLERDRETALALQAARKKAGHNPLTPYPVKVCKSAPSQQSIYLLLSGTHYPVSKGCNPSTAACLLLPLFSTLTVACVSVAPGCA